MSIINKVRSWAIKNFTSDNDITRYNTKFEKTNDKGRRFSDQLNRERTYAYEVGQDGLKDAIREAEDVYYPNRTSLLEIIKEVLRDFHLRSQMNSAIYKVTANAFVVTTPDNAIQNDLNYLIENNWFIKTMEYVLQAEFYGHSLLEFQQLIEKNGELVISNVEIFPREHVIPERGEIKLNAHDNTGLKYRNDPLISEWFLEAGDPYDLGILSIAAKYSIYKKYALSDWSRSMERWGDPIIHIGSASMDAEENKKKENWAKSFGKNGYIVGDVDDEVNLLERKEGSGYKIFEDNILMQDKENSKGVNGQVGTSDENAYVGTAEVQERMMNDYTKARMRKLVFWLNDVLIPYLIQLNGGNTAYSKLEGMQIQPLYLLHEDEDEENEDPLDDDPSDDAPNDDKSPENRTNSPFGGRGAGARKPGGASPVGKSRKSFKGLKL